MYCGDSRQVERTGLRTFWTDVLALVLSHRECPFVATVSSELLSLYCHGDTRKASSTHEERIR